MMKAVLFVLAMIVAVTMAAQLSNEQYQFLFTKYVDQYNKQYQTREFFDKFSTFKSNLDLIVAHNAKNLSWKMAVNQFADLSAEEFAAQFTGLNTNLGQEYAMSQLQAPVSKNFRYSEVDWVEKGLVNPIKNQASCGMFYFIIIVYKSDFSFYCIEPCSLFIFSTQLTSFPFSSPSFITTFK